MFQTVHKRHTDLSLVHNLWLCRCILPHSHFGQIHSMFPAVWRAGKFPFYKTDLKDDLSSGTGSLSCRKLYRLCLHMTPGIVALFAIPICPEPGSSIFLLMLCTFILSLLSRRI